MKSLVFAGKRPCRFSIAAAILLLTCMASVPGCGNKEDGVQVISLQEFRPGSPLTDGMLDAISEDTRTVELVAEGDITVPSDPQNIKLYKDRIFILDHTGVRSFQMLAFDTEGKLIKKIGASGRGPGEYFVITDFAVAPDGSLWINDAGTDNMLHFDSSLEYVGTYPAEYDTDCFEFLPNGDILANVSQWDTELVEIAVTDTVFSKERRRPVFNYRHEPHPLYGFGDGTLFKTGEGYIHNHPIDPDVYLLDSDNGNVLRHYRLDTGSETLTYDDLAGLGDDDIKYGKLMEEHTYLSKVFYMTDRHIIGTLMEKGECVYFMADLDSLTIHKNRSENMNPVSGYSDGWLISTVYPEKETDHYKLVLRKIH